MIRLIIENILLFLLPATMYLAYAYLTRRSDAKGSLLDDAPLIWLFAAGAVLVVVVLVAFGNTSGGRPGQAYSPPYVKDGKIVPGHSQ